MEKSNQWIQSMSWYDQSTTQGWEKLNQGIVKSTDDSQMRSLTKGLCKDANGVDKVLWNF